MQSWVWDIDIISKDLNEFADIIKAINNNYELKLNKLIEV